MADMKDGVGVPAAFKGALMLAGWTDSHNAGPKISFFLQDPEQLEAFRTLTVRKGNTAGQMFAAVLFLTDDNGNLIAPVGYAPPRDSEHDVTRAAALLCKNEEFQRYVASCAGHGVDADEDNAITWMRATCGVDSRSQIKDSPTALQRFRLLQDEFNAWRSPNVRFTAHDDHR